MNRIRRIFAVACAVILLVSTLPLYAISAYNHPYYDDYGFSANVYHAWKESGSLLEAAEAAVESVRLKRDTWQGNYTITLICNLQPGTFSEDLYWISNGFLITSLIVCMLFFFYTVFGALGLAKSDRISLGCLAVTLMIQFMPDVGEAFFWFNGGLSTLFIHALIALGAAFCVRLMGSRGFAATAALVVLAVLVGGGSYGGGLFALCMLVCALVWLFGKRHEKRWHVLLIASVFVLCFWHNVSAPGNAVRAGMIGYQASPVKAVIQSLYYGVGQIGSYIRLPLIAVTLVMLPAIFGAARRSRFRFDHPWLVLALMTALYCTQLTPPLYSIASIGAGRQVNTYYMSFIVCWFLYVYYLAGFAARRMQKLPEITPRRFGALVLVSICLLGVGCLSFKRSCEVLYGIQNMSGPSALLSMINGEAQQYDREMSEREQLLRDESLPEVTLRPLTVNPAVFMEDQLKMGAIYDVRPSLKMYYGKEAIHLEGEGE